MKVGIVVPYSWSFWGGVPEHADHQARALERLGVDARIVIGHDPPGRLTKYLHPRVGRHEQPPAHVIPIGRSVIVPANGALPNIVLSPSAIVRMKQVLERERFDLLHVHEPMTPAIGVAARIQPRSPDAWKVATIGHRAKASTAVQIAGVIGSCRCSTSKRSRSRIRLIRTTDDGLRTMLGSDPFAGTMTDRPTGSTSGGGRP